MTWPSSLRMKRCQVKDLETAGQSGDWHTLNMMKTYQWLQAVDAPNCPKLRSPKKASLFSSLMFWLTPQCHLKHFLCLIRWLLRPQWHELTGLPKWRRQLRAARVDKSDNLMNSPYVWLDLVWRCSSWVISPARARETLRQSPSFLGSFTQTTGVHGLETEPNKNEGSKSQTKASPLQNRVLKHVNHIFNSL